MLLRSIAEAESQERKPRIRRKSTKEHVKNLELTQSLLQRCGGLFHTCVEVFKSMVIVCFPRDNETPLKDKPSATVSISKFIHGIISLDDVKVVKNAMNITVTDVFFLGIVQAGLSRY
ncbi:hypothetical protein F2Q68_00036075 [Brassica cretica]|uniref:Uncharacterized protein n=1 Tax=Brassica cretica TaxID=69181 RepID=A0A8S9H9P2_BRACR|nr:hypothetical protein F2Q68_00036075 [Brassica cretica]